MLVHGETYQLLTSQGKDLPPALIPPGVFPGYEGWLEDFWELSTDRQLGFGGAGPIPKSSIDRHIIGWKPSDADLFRSVIRALDRVVLSNAAGEPIVIEATAAEGGAEKSAQMARDNFRAAFKG